MLKNRCHPIQAATLLAMSFLMVFTKQAFAQRNEADLTAFLLNSADCVLSGSSNRSRLYDDVAPVSINRQVFDRLFAMGARYEGGNSTISCRANSQKFGLVDLQMGMHDNSARSEATMTVNVYQGGNLKHTYNSVQAGTLINVVLDLNDPEVANNPDSFAVEIFDCNAGSPDYQCYLQFVEARLYPVGSYTGSPGSNNTPSQSSSSIPTADQPQTSPPSSRQDTTRRSPSSSREDAPSSSSGSFLDDIITDIIEDIFN